MTAEEISQLVAGKLDGNGSVDLRGVAQLEDATASDLSFAEGDQGIRRAAASRAGCVLIPEGEPLSGQTTIAVRNPKLAFIRAAQALHPASRPAAGIHSSALVSADAVIGENVSIGPNAVVDSGVSIGRRTQIGAGVIVGEGSEIGSDCNFYPGVTIYAGARIGDCVVLHSGVVIGGDGFGYVLAGGRYHKFPQIGGVLIENEVEIGCNTTIDRGSLGTTVIGEGTKIDNLVQIAHNVKVGKHCVIAAQTGISGSATIGDYVVIAGQVGVGERARIESRVVIGGQAGILPGKVVHEDAVVWGTPARPLAELKRLHACFALLPELVAKFKRFSRGTSTPDQ